MARINLEDSLFQKIGWIELVIELKNADTALGALMRAWVVAQRFWKENDHGIPKSVWKKERLNDAIIGRLADDCGDFIYVHGSREQFAWIRQRTLAGKSGGEASVKAKREIIEENSKQSQASSSGFNPPSLPLPLSLSLPLTQAQDLNLSEGFASRPPPKPKRQVPKVDTAETWDAYREAYKIRYREEPIRNATVNAQLAQFVKRIPLEEAPLVAEFYLTHNDAFYVKQLHPVGLLLKDAEALRTQWARGRAVTGADARTVERMQNNINAFAVFATLDKRNPNGNV